jgi:hypothetical protein
MKTYHIFFTLILALSLVQCQKKVKDSLPPPIDTLPTPIVPNANFRLLDSTQLVTDLKLLSSDAYKGRKAGTAEVALTHNLIINRLRQAGVDSFSTGFEQTFTLAGVARKNLLGYIRGSQFPNQYIVVGAHFDHLGTNTSGAVFHGADDNASGVSATLALAKYFTTNRPRYSIIFALWDAEENGLAGSKHFTNNLPAPLTLAALRFNLNADMIARSDNNSIWLAGLSHYPAYKYLVDSIRPQTITSLKSGYDKPTDPQDWTFLSDHGSFHTKGIPFGYLGVEDHADYHKITDTYQKVNLNRFVENANIFLQMARMLDRKL